MNTGLLMGSSRNPAGTAWAHHDVAAPCWLETSAQIVDLKRLISVTLDGVVTTRRQEPHSHTAASLEKFILAERASLVGFAFGLTGSREQAEDIVQDVLLRLLSANMEEIIDMRSYARRAVVNETRSWHRRLARHRIRSDQLEVEASRSAEQGRPQLSQVEVFQLLDGLTTRQRTIVVAKYYFDLPDAEVASLLGCSAATVRSAASQALRNVRVALISDEKTDERR